MKSKVMKKYKSNWHKVQLPETLKHVGGMTSFQEKHLLYDVSVNHFKNIGCIVDGGCFLGGSTMCLGVGLKDKINTEIIHAYDNFIANNKQHNETHMPKGYKEGDSFLSLFKENIKEISHLVKIYNGNIIGQPPPDKNIEIFFVDIAKTPFINDYIVEHFFSLLIPGHSLVIHQDYIWCACNGWIHTTMEYLSDYFEVVDITDNTGTVVFQLKKAIPKEKLRNVFFGRSKDEAIYLQIQAIKKLKLNEKQRCVLDQSIQDMALNIDFWHDLNIKRMKNDF